MTTPNLKRLFENANKKPKEYIGMYALDTVIIQASEYGSVLELGNSSGERGFIIVEGPGDADLAESNIIWPRASSVPNIMYIPPSQLEEMIKIFASNGHAVSTVQDLVGQSVRAYYKWPYLDAIELK
jgi:hypothetical protein